MTLQEFLNHWNLVESPFQGEEARTDRVFGRMNGQGAPTIAPADAHAPLSSYHPEFDRVLGDLTHPASAVVFGEKGSGKTAMRLQIAARVRDHNAENPERKVLLVSLDDLTPMLTRLHDRYAGKSPLESFQRTRVVDHLDAAMQAAVSRLTDAMLQDPQPEASSEQMVSIGPEPKKKLRSLDPAVRRDLLLLQSLYDRPSQADERTRRLRRRLGLRASVGDLVARIILVAWPLAVIAFFVWGQYRQDPAIRQSEWFKWGLLFASGVYGVLLLGYIAKQVVAVRQLGRRVRRQMPACGRGFRSFARSLSMIGGGNRGQVPTTDAVDGRLVLLDKLRRALGLLGYAGMIVVIDRVDEPPLIAGDVDRMKHVIWPLLSNRVLQVEGVGIKLLLPIELRHALYKESNSFFQEARLDKQGFVDRLAWSGTSLYDLCNGRLRACTRAATMGLANAHAGLSLIDLFADDVTRQDLVEALEQMHQPRDAFKLLHRCVVEHCSSASLEAGQWRIPRYILEVVKKQEVERVQGLYRGIRPA
jgi:hypothetical protein